MSQTLLYQWTQEIRRRFPNLKKWQAVGLALFSYGVVIARHCQLSRVAEELPQAGKADTVQRRLQRFLSNTRIDVQLCCRWWIGWVWSCCELPRPVLLVDETRLGAYLGVMMVSLAFEKRAIPLIWRCYVGNSAQDYPQEGQVKLIAGLLEQVRAALPADCRPLVEADRGIGNSSDLMAEMTRLNLHFLFRQKKNSTFTTRRGKKHKLADLVKLGERWTGRGWLFSKPGCQTKVWLHLIWEAGQKEPWCLATNDPTIAGEGYAVRMWQEESFRDLKSGGWQWQCSQVRQPQRAERLLLVLALAYAWMLTQGTFVLHADRETQLQITRGQTRKYCVFRQGLRYLKRMLYLAPTKIYVGLFFAPAPYKPLC